MTRSLDAFDESGANIIEADGLPQVLMGAERAPARTLGNGVFQPDHRVPSGSYRASASKGDSRSAEEKFTVGEGPTAEVRLRLR